MTAAEKPALRAYTKLVALSTFVLLLAGGMVTSTASGLAVPDWPLSFGQWMPPMEGGVLYEHGHRMIAGVVGSMIGIEAIWLWRAEPRRWVRTLGWISLGGVIAQALLGGLTVLMRLPDAISVSHAGLAELVFGLTVVIALVCSEGWREAAESGRPVDAGVPSLFTIGVVASVLVFLQIVLGAIVRHTGAGLVIPDFPLAYGELVPPLVSPAVQLHFAHRVGAVVVAVVAIWVVWRVWRAHRGVSAVTAPAAALGALVALQIGLGGWTVLSHKDPWVTTAHLGTGALIFATTLVLTLRARRHLRLTPAVAHPPIEPRVDLAEVP
ncbi:MAG: COX15/CtaA family protein [Gemmatimonadota bacterium]|nr:COX15/CtaA family protein [Gemmatimonadota bacterium]